MAYKPINLEHLVSSISYNGIDYEFPNVTNVTYNNPVTNNMLSSPQGNTNGISYKTGLTQGSSCTLTLRELDEDDCTLLKSIFDKGDRVDFTGFDSQTGKTLECKSAVISTDPDNGTIGDTETDFDVTLSLSFAWNNGSYSFKQV